MDDPTPGGLQPGICTLIVARPGPTSPHVDAALLAAVEQEAGLAPGLLEPVEDLDAREFRVVEGVSRDVADRLAAVARQLGYVPRIRERLGIRWSSERGTEMALGFGLLWMAFGLLWALGFPLVAALFGPAALIPAMALAVPIVMVAVAGMYRWQLARLYLPLAVSARDLPAPDLSAVGLASREALVALSRLQRALHAGALPEFATADLAPTLAHFRTQVQQRTERLRAEASRGLAQLRTLEQRLEHAAPDALDELARELEAAEAAETEREAREQQGIDTLLAVAELTTRARVGLQADPPDLEPLEALRQATRSPDPTRSEAERSPTDQERARRQSLARERSPP